MHFAFSKTGHCLRLLPPDYTEGRGDRVLLVWGGLPYWTVVDRELHRLLTLLNGEMPVEEVIGSNPDWARQQREILGLLMSLRQVGVLRETGKDVPRAGDACAAHREYRRQSHALLQPALPFLL